MARIREVLGIPNFFFLWLGQVISQFGDRLTQMVLIGLIYKRAPGSAYELAKLFIFVVVPVFVVGPVAGVYADRWKRKYTMLVSDVIRGILVLLIASYLMLVPKLHPIFPIYLIVFTIFSTTRFFIPAKMSIIPDLVPQDKLLEANSLIHTTGMIAAMLGLGLGGILVSIPAVGVKGGLLIDAATFFISAILISFIRINKEPQELKENIYAIGRRVKEIIRTSVIEEIGNGLKYIFSHRKMHFVIALLFLLWSGIGASYVVMIVFIQKALASVTRHLGLLAMLFGAGLFCGSVIYGKYGQRISRTKAIFLSLVLGGMFLVNFVLLVDIGKNFYLITIIAFLFGVSLSPIMISSNTIIHELIPDELRGRVFSSLEAVMHLAFFIFMLACSILAEFVNPSFILLAVGVVFVYCGILGLRSAARLSEKV